MKCLCSGEQARADGEATTEFSAGDRSPHIREEGREIVDAQNIEAAESSLREGGCLNYEEARALLGRMEYNQGNFEGALHVFEGIDIPVLVPKMILTIAKTGEHQRRRARGSSSSIIPMSMHAVSLMFEAIFLRAKSLEHLGRFEEAAQICTTLLGTIESSFPEGLPDNFGDRRLQETINRAVELLPELWKLAGHEQEAVSSYRRALLSNWNLSPLTTAKVQKQFAVFLLHGGFSANSPEESLLLLMILLREFSLKKIQWDPTVLDHLIFALCVCGGLRALSTQLEELLPGAMEREERNYLLALCYHAEGEDSVALNLIGENPKSLRALLLASKICGMNGDLADRGASYARGAIAELGEGSQNAASVAHLLLGISLSASGISPAESLAALERAHRTRRNDYQALYHLGLENAKQRKLDAALRKAKRLLELEAGMNLKSWLLLGRILSAKKCYSDALHVVDAATEQTGMKEQGELLLLKARIHVACGEPKIAVETYGRLLAVGRAELEAETWYDLANVYASMGMLNDVDVCLRKMKIISPSSALRWHATGQMYDAKGLHREALLAYGNALEVDSAHVSTLVSTSIALRKMGNPSLFFARGMLADALRADRTSHAAWFNLGLLHSSDRSHAAAIEAAECFQAAVLLEESAPVEPFR